MKRKIFSKLLMVALVIAAMSSFVSCKDYDDDINNLQKQIDAAALKTQVATLESALQTAQQNIQTAQAAADAAKAAADNAKAAAETAKAEAIEEAISKVNALAAQIAEGYVTEKDFSDAVAKLAATAEALDEAVANLYSKEKGEELETKLADLIVKVAAIDPKLVALSEKDTELAGLIGTNTAKIADNAVAIEQLKNQMKADELFKILGDKYTTSAAATAIANAALAKADARIDSLKNAINTALEAYAKKTDLDAYAKKVSVDSLKSRMQAAELAIQGLAGLDSTQIKAIVDGLGAKVDTASFNAVKAQLSAMANNVDIMSLYISKQLTSLVFKPEMYMDGIETSFIYAFVNPRTYTVANAGTKDESWTGKSLSSKSLYPSAELFYHFNPATANLDGYKATFYNNLAATWSTRGVNDIIKPLDENLSNDNKTDENGILSVRIANNKDVWEALNKVYQTSYYSNSLFVALQASKGDTLVNSDYARVMPVNLNNLVLADNGAGRYYCSIDHRWDLTTSATDAISFYEYESHKIKYDTANVDLKQFIETHYTFGYYGSHNMVPESMLEELGLSYKFKAISYVREQYQDETDESIHIKVTEDGLATPQEVDNTGKVIGDNKKRGAIGREPVVRVTLEDADGAVYAYGYIKLIIAEDVKPAVDAELTFNGTMYANCDETEGLTLTWSQVEADLLNEVDFSHNDLLAHLAGYDTGSEIGQSYDYWYDDQNYLTLYQYVKVNGSYVTTAENNRTILEAIYQKWHSGVETYDLTADDVAEQMVAEFYENGGVGSVVWEEYPEISNPTSANAPATLGNDPEFDFDAMTHRWGHVTITKPTANQDARTTLFTWNLDNEDQHTLNDIVPGFVVNGESSKPLTFSVLLPGSPDLYIDFVIPAKAIKFASISLNDDATLNKYWYNADATVVAEGAARELRANVTTPQTTGAANDDALENTDFKFNILSTFVGGKLTTTSGTQFSEFADYADGNASFLFTTPASAAKDAALSSYNNIKNLKVWTVNGASGSTYSLAVTDEGTKIRIVKRIAPAELYSYDGTGTPISDKVYTGGGAKTANGKVSFEYYNTIAYAPVVVELTDGDKAMNELVTFSTDSLAQDILNYKGHSALKNNETFAAYVKITLDESEDYCYQPKLDSADAFAIRFLRPVDAEKLAAATGKDAIDGYSVADLFNAADPTKNMLKLSDWRGYDFFAQNAAKAYTNLGYFNYYGVKLTVGEASDIRTDLQLSAGATVTDPSTLITLADALGSNAGGTPIITDVDDIPANGQYFFFTVKYNNVYEHNQSEDDGAGYYKKDEITMTYADVQPETGITYVPAAAAIAYKAGETSAKAAEPAYFKGAPVITYRNNTGNVQTFNLYIPIFVTYTFGETIPYTQKVWGQVTISKTEGSSARAK